jgi:hypothetical protein
MLYPCREIRLVDRLGNAAVPDRCTATFHIGSCVFFRNGAVKPIKPMLTASGPVFVAIPRLRCKEHGGECVLQTGLSALHGEGKRLSPSFGRLGEVSAC